MIYNDAAIDALSVSLLERNDKLARWGMLISSYLALPGLRGFWPMSAAGVSGEALDLSGLGNHLTNTNSAEFGNEGLIPYTRYDGTNRHSITDAGSSNAFDILGSEAFIVSPGLTFGFWCKFDSDAGGGADTLLAKFDTSSDAYRFYRRTSGNGGVGRFDIDDGATTINAEGPTELVSDTWYNVVCRYNPLIEIEYLLNNAQDASNESSVPATLNNSTQNFTIGALSDGTQDYEGLISLAFICASYLSDEILFALFEQGRVLFGV